MKRRKIQILVGAILALIGLVWAYAPVLNAPLLWDDENFITKNPDVHEIQNPWVYVSDASTLSEIPIYNESIYRPLRTFFFSVQYSFFEESGVGYHIVSLFLHMAIGILLFFCLLKLGLPSALSGILSGVWLFHPAHTEVVSFVSSQGDLWVGVFVLGAALAGLRSKTLYVLFFGLALLSKEVAVLAWVFHLLFFLLQREKPLKKQEILARILPGLFLSLIYVLWRYSLLGRMTQIESVGHPLANIFLLVPKTVLSYFTLFFYPVDLVAFYSRIRWTGLEWIFLGMFLLLAFWTWRTGLRRKILLFIFGTVWFLLFLAPVSNLIPISTPFAERFIYLPSMGIVLLCGVLGMSVGEHRVWAKRSAFVVCMLGILIFTFLTRERNGVWADEAKLFYDIIEKSPEHKVAYENLLLTLHERNRHRDLLELAEVYEKKWEPTIQETFLKMEAFCQEGEKQPCVETASKLLASPDYADRAAWRIIRTETERGRSQQVRDLRNQFCAKNPSMHLCK